MAVLAWAMMGIAIWHFADQARPLLGRHHRELRVRGGLRRPGRLRACGLHDPRRGRHSGPDGARGHPRGPHRARSRLLHRRAPGQRAGTRLAARSTSRRWFRRPPATYGAAVDDVRFDIAPAPFAAQLAPRSSSPSVGRSRRSWCAGVLSDPAAACAFLNAADRHDASQFAGIDAAVSLILAHVERAFADRRPRRLRLRRRQLDGDPGADAARARRAGLVVPARAAPRTDTA